MTAQCNGKLAFEGDNPWSPHCTFKTFFNKGSLICQSITVFKLNTDAFVTITGLSPEMGKTTATLYNMLGMIVRSKTLNNTAATQQISTQGLASGVYIIKLKAGEQGVSKKIIIQ